MYIFSIGMKIVHNMFLKTVRFYLKQTLFIS